MLVIVVDTVYYRNGFLQCLEITVKDAAAACSLRIYKGLYARIRFVTPPSDANIYPADIGRPLFQGCYIRNILRLRIAEHVHAVLANRFAVASQSSVTFHIDIEQYDIPS